MAGLTQQLAEFIATLDARRIPAQALETAKRGTADCIGVLFAGRDEPVVRLVCEMANVDAVRGEARVLYDRGRASAADAALVNGTAAHALDYDDTGLDGHPSVALVPAILAEGERVDADGMALLAAYVAGYETWAELTWRDEDRHHAKGWHPTAVFGTVAAAAAAARLQRLDAARTQAALGIAASMASGLVANFGSMTKPLQVGRAAQNGITAAQLAARGVTASPDALEHPAGLLAALSPSGRVRTTGEIAAGRDWHILKYGLNVKRYPVCYGMHRVIDGMLELVARHRFAAADVAAVEVTVGRVQAGMLRQHSPRTGLDAKFSAEFGMASAILAQRVGTAELTDAFVASAPVQALLPLVGIAATDELDPADPVFSPSDSVRVKLRDGSLLDSGPIRHPRGHARNPIGVEELHAKFADCVGGALAPAERERLFEQVSKLETLARTSLLYGR